MCYPQNAFSAKPTLVLQEARNQICCFAKYNFIFIRLYFYFFFQWSQWHIFVAEINIVIIYFRSKILPGFIAKLWRQFEPVASCRFYRLQWPRNWSNSPGNLFFSGLKSLDTKNELWIGTNQMKKKKTRLVLFFFFLSWIFPSLMLVCSIFLSLLGNNFQYSETSTKITMDLESLSCEHERCKYI